MFVWGCLGLDSGVDRNDRRRRSVGNFPAAVPPSPTRMNKFSYSGYRFPPGDHIQRAIWLLPPVHAQPARRRRFVGRARSGGVLRDGSALGEPFRTCDRCRLTKASPGAPHDLASRRGPSQNRRPTFAGPSTDREDTPSDAERNELAQLREATAKRKPAQGRFVTDRP